jgi:antitoxin (DNA-binding transcriptional repressor) of toxin-antitoxin stability system
MSENLVHLPPAGSRSTRTLTTNQKGAIAELKIAAAALDLDIPVLKPFSEHARYDLMFDLGDGVVRVQCKWARREGEVVIVRVTAQRISTRGRIITTYGAHEIDAVAGYCAALDQCYLLPAHLVAGMSEIRLRLSPPRNAQRAWIHWASDYYLSGAIAQLGERGTGSAEVGGSNPPSSTVSTDVGAHEFREHLGWYLQRIAGGERFVITRRGKPFARLESVDAGSNSPQAIGERVDPVPQLVGPADLEVASDAGEQAGDPVQ